MKTVIMAGGRGTRIAQLNSEIPKPMIEINNKPVLEHQINCLKAQGFNDIIITVSYLADKIINYFGDGKKFGVNIEYFVENKPLGNAGALFMLKDKLDEAFLLLNGDIIFDVDLVRFIDFHNKKHSLVTLMTHPNNHPYDGGLIIADENNSVFDWLTKEDTRPKWYKNRINAGLHIISPEILRDSHIDSQKIDLDRQILKPLCGKNQMFCYDSPEYIHDMGTPQRYYEVCKDLLSGKIEARSLRNKQKAIFLDRDGTINKHVGFLNDIDDFELLPGVCEAVRKINASGYLAVVATNQPVIARGELSFSGLNEIHNKMETLLGNEGAYIDGLYFCPHHPDKGFDGEISELKINCECRKPKTGMFINAAEKFNIDLSNSWVVGDSENDVLAGKNAGCMTALIGSKNFGQDMTVTTLLEFAQKLGD